MLLIFIRYTLLCKSGPMNIKSIKDLKVLRWPRNGGHTRTLPSQQTNWQVPVSVMWHCQRLAESLGMLPFHGKFPEPGFWDGWVLLWVTQLWLRFNSQYFSCYRYFKVSTQNLYSLPWILAQGVQAVHFFSKEITPAYCSTLFSQSAKEIQGHLRLFRGKQREIEENEDTEALSKCPSCLTASSKHDNMKSLRTHHKEKQVN